MTAWARIAAQVLVVTVFVAAVALLSDRPRYRVLEPDTAVMKLSFSHGSNRQAECRRRTAEELAKLPPNMRNPLDCPRGRGSVYVELDVDGRSIYRASLPPAGISGDGPSRIYKRFVVAPGAHSVAVRMRDTSRTEGFDYAKSGDIVLAAEQNFVVDFRTEADNLERITAHFAGRQGVEFPAVRREMSTARILTTDWIDGVKVSDRARLQHLADQTRSQ